MAMAASIDDGIAGTLHDGRAFFDRPNPSASSGEEFLCCTAS
jgi:hypothetical protein